MRLFLLRHAKSDWNAGTSDDHARPLSARGRKAAPRIGAYMKAKGYRPDLVLCSSAARTRETLALIRPYLKPAPEIQNTRTLYLADWPALLAAVQALPANAQDVLMIGHNPGLERLAAALAALPASAEEEARAERMAAKFPTAALAVFVFTLPRWRDVARGTGELADFVRPRDLPETRA